MGASGHVPQPGARSPLWGLLRSPSTSAQGTRVETFFPVPARRETTVVPLGPAGLRVELEKPSPRPRDVAPVGAQRPSQARSQNVRTFQSHSR